MKYLIAGLGSIGAKHARTLKSVDNSAEIIFVRSSRKRNAYVEALEKEMEFKMYTDLDSALQESPDACLICNPTSKHVETASSLVGKCKAILIEKPLSHTLEGVDDLIKKAERHKTAVLVAYCLRWHPILLKVKEILDSGRLGKIHFANILVGQHLSDWRKQDYRKSYSSKKSMGGGVVLDLSHEVDYAYWLFGKPREVRGTTHKVSKLEIDTEDVAEISMKYRDMMCQVHMDYLRKQPKRTLEIVGEKGSLFADMIGMRITMQEENIDLSAQGNEMYEEELKHFIACVEGKEKPKINLKEGKIVLDICLEALK